MKLIKVLLFASNILLVFTCQDRQVELTEATIADFDFKIMGDCSTPVLQVEMENKTKNAHSFLWDFGDGTTSTLSNPTKIYSKSGKYKIQLTAFFATGKEEKDEKDISIGRNSDGTGPDGNVLTTIHDLELEFNITTNAASSSLDFGDGSKLLSVQTGTTKIYHRYSGPGRYGVLAIFQNSEGCNCVNAELNLAP